MKNTEQFKEIYVGLAVRNRKTQKNWMITEFITGYSTISKKTPDVFKVRVSDGAGNNKQITIEDLNKKFIW